MTKHILITGTGRAGTTFLVQLLGHLGFDIGNKEVHEETHCGLEHDLRKGNAPYVCKHPLFCEFAGDIFKSKEIEIEYILLPVRDLHDAAESRRYASKVYGFDAPGGLWGAKDRVTQEVALARRLYNLIYETAKTDVKIILMNFPLIVNDGNYLYGKLRPMLKDISLKDFTIVFNDIAHPEWVHDFSMTKKED